MLVAAVQMRSTADRDRNLGVADQLVREAAARGARMVVLPEKWTALGAGAAEAAEARDGTALSWAADTARELGIDLVAGSLLVRGPDEELPSNLSAHFGPGGDLRAEYRKLHMFDALVDGTVYDESAQEQAGADVTVSELADGTRVGLSICYDLRFPELYRALVDRGAQVLTIPSAFTLATTRDHWEVLVRARAIENQCFVVAANQFGRHGDGTRSGGRSLIVDPWGIVLACAPDGQGVIVADLDFERQSRIRDELPALQHRRPELFGLREGEAG